MTKKSLFRPRNIEGERIIPSFHIEADGIGKSVYLLISGVIGIKGFSEEEIVIATKREIICVRGELLQISVFESRRVGIRGKIEGISFSERKKGNRR